MGKKLDLVQYNLIKPINNKYEHQEWCLKKMEPQDKQQSQTHRESLTTL